MPRSPARVWMKRIALTLVSLIVLLLLGIYLFLRGSLAQLDGTISGNGLHNDVTITRDDKGVPTITGKDRNDVAYATGFVHAQERFFQMDLTRRAAAGELSELFGDRALNIDKDNRLHRFRARATQYLALASAEDRAFLDSYVRGVNDGLNRLSTRPFEYAILGQAPRPWIAEDSLLVVWAMYLDLQGNLAEHDLTRTWLKEHTTSEQLAFLLPTSSPWDATMDSDEAKADTHTIPATAPDWWKQTAKSEETKISAIETHNDVGSNNWAVAGTRSATGAAIVSDDMHLSIRLPGTWYRASLQFPDARGVMQRLVGVTLPGALPVIVAGSNGNVAWGFTNSYGDYLDLVELQIDPKNPMQACVQAVCEAINSHHEIIKIKGATPIDLEIRESKIGPLRQVGAKTYAVHWTAHTPQAVNFNVRKLEGAKTAEEAIALAATFGMPAQNIMVGDKAGNIAWSIAGPLPRRTQSSWDASFALAKDTQANTWTSFLTPEEYPRVMNPKSGQLWTANSQQLQGSGAELIGNGGFDLGARAQQIRDDLTALPSKAEVKDVYQITLDDRALFLTPWRERALKVLSPEAIKDHPQRAEFLKLLNTTWTGHANVDSVAYRLSRDYFYAMHDIVFDGLKQHINQGDKGISMRNATARWSTVVVRMIDEQATAWLPATYQDWNEVQLAAIDRAIKKLTENGQSLAQATWGKRNTATISHPMASAMPSPLKAWLSVPPDMLAGDGNMPRVAAPAFGQSERFTVSPGQEDKGFMTIPGGQSGHPLSPFFLAGHADWVSGKPTPFLPGATVHTLTLKK